jgi:hypothetical protein
VFYAWRQDGIKDWNKIYRQLPSNYILLDRNQGVNQIPPDIQFDLVLSQNKFGQIQVLKQLAQKLHLPLVSIEHTLPVPNWPKEQLAYLKSMKGDVNIFISEMSRDKWGWNKDEAAVIHHGIDTGIFHPGNRQRKKLLLSVVNDWVNRNWCCGFDLWRAVSQDLPFGVLGDTPGLSAPAKSLNELVSAYQSSQVFLNTSLISPVPSVMLEAAACGCAIVSTNNCAIPEFFTHKHDAYLSNDPKELRAFCITLLNNPEECQRIGQNAVETIKTKCNLLRFTDQWNQIFQTAAAVIYKGQ